MNLTELIRTEQFWCDLGEVLWAFGLILFVFELGRRALKKYDR